MQPRLPRTLQARIAGVFLLLIVSMQIAGYAVVRNAIDRNARHHGREELAVGDAPTLEFTAATGFASASDQLFSIRRESQRVDSINNRRLCVSCADNALKLPLRIHIPNESGLIGSRADETMFSSEGECAHGCLVPSQRINGFAVLSAPGMD